MGNKIKSIKTCVRPIISERHDFSAALFKNKESNEPIFHIASKGDFNIDVLKVLSLSLIAGLTLSAFSLSSQYRKKKIKKLKAELKAAKK